MQPVYSTSMPQSWRRPQHHKRTFSTQLRCPLYPRKRTFRDSLDQLIGALLEVKRYVESERSGRLQVDDKLEFRRLQDREVSGLGAIEDLTGIGADLTIHAHTIGVVAHQPAGFDSLATGIARGNSVVCRKRNKLDASAGEEHVTSDVQGLRAVTHEGGEGSLDFTPGAGVEDLNLQSQCTGD